MHGLEKDQGAGLAHQGCQTLAPLAGFARQKPFEHEPVGGQPGRLQRRQQSAGSGHWDDPNAPALAGLHQRKARIADQGCARITDQSHILARCQSLTKSRDTLRLIMFVHRHKWRMAPETR
jgi:hypothetical protein